MNLRLGMLLEVIHIKGILGTTVSSSFSYKFLLDPEDPFKIKHNPN